MRTAPVKIGVVGQLDRAGGNVTAAGPGLPPRDDVTGAVRDVPGDVGARDVA